MLMWNHLIKACYEHTTSPNSSPALLISRVKQTISFVNNGPKSETGDTHDSAYAIFSFTQQRTDLLISISYGCKTFRSCVCVCKVIIYLTWFYYQFYIFVCNKRQGKVRSIKCIAKLFGGPFISIPSYPEHVSPRPFCHILVYDITFAADVFLVV